MRRILITGGTTFVSKYAADFFVKMGDQVTLLNRGTKPQPEGTTLLMADRHQLGDALRGRNFDAILDITAYDAKDVIDLLDSGVIFSDYLLISSSAVYPEWEKQPFSEESAAGENIFWGKYGTDKIAAERALRERAGGAYVIRPPYLYGAYNNVYREAFVFDCAMAKRPFYLPGDGGLRLQFFHVEDLCRLMDAILRRHPEEHILNAGNPETVSAREWVKMCFRAAGAGEPEMIRVPGDVPQRSYFSFYDYEYRLDVSRQSAFLPEVKPLEEGLAEAFAWYRLHPDQVVRKPFLEYIDRELAGKYGEAK